MTGALEREFPQWEISYYPAGLDIVSALRVSEDRRHWRYVVCRSAAELLGRLRQLREEEQLSSALTH
jgi:hypothetical protein